ncbi:hypothetical protein ACTA71_005290 [Dictyostelium dimigraforme]
MIITVYNLTDVPRILPRSKNSSPQVKNYNKNNNSSSINNSYYSPIEEVKDAPKSSFSKSRNNGSNNIKDTTGFLDDNIQGNIYSFVFKGVTIYHKLNGQCSNINTNISTSTTAHQQQHNRQSNGGTSVILTTVQSTKQQRHINNISNTNGSSPTILTTTQSTKQQHQQHLYKRYRIISIR